MLTLVGLGQVFTDTTATFSSAEEIVWHAAVSQGGPSAAPMTLTPSDGPNSGKEIHCLYENAKGPETQIITVACGQPGEAKAPESDDAAMST